MFRKLRTSVAVAVAVAGCTLDEPPGTSGDNLPPPCPAEFNFHTPDTLSCNVTFSCEQDPALPVGRVACESECSPHRDASCLTKPGCQARFLQHRYTYFWLFTCTPTLGGQGAPPACSSLDAFECVKWDHCAIDYDQGGRFVRCRDETDCRMGHFGGSPPTTCYP